MSITQTSTAIFDLGTVAATERKRTTSKGTATRVTLDYRSSPIIAHHDPRMFRPVAAAMAKVIGEQMAAIQESASSATLLKRRYAKNALDKGKGWAVRRYDGGRTGRKEPDTQVGGRLFNDSGRFAEGLVSTATSDGTFTINVPKNRLDPSTFTPAQFEAMLRRLFELVPALGDPASIMRVPAVHAAFEEVGKHVMEVAGSAAAARLKQAIQEFGANVQELGGVVGQFAEE